MNNVVNIHAGHRKRLRQQIETTEPYNLSDLHFLEYILTFVIPRADTNPIAHALLAEFKNIVNIYTASKEALLAVKGVGEKTANFLKSLDLIWYVKNKALAEKDNFVGTLNSMLTYARRILPTNQNEQFLVVIVSKNNYVKTFKIFNGTSHSLINLDLKELTNFLVMHKASFCFMAHTHPDHTASPSHSDAQAFIAIENLLNSLSIVLLDNLILGDENFFSLKLNDVRTYNEIQMNNLTVKTLMSLRR